MSIAPDSSLPHAGDILGDRYLLRERIGAGGMGRVFRARDRVLQRDVAIKIFFADRSDEPEPLRRLSEARALAALDHPSLVTLYDARLTGEDHVYLVMELVEGPSLQRRIEQGPIATTEVAGILRDLAGALSVVHAAGIVHRDIKPSNVLLRPLAGTDGALEAVLADFGVAHLIDATSLTTPGTVIGTAAYLAPEQVRGEAPQPASDIYALGLLGIEALTRLHPFGIGSLQETLLARLARQPEVPGAFGYGWRALLTAMTAPDPAARPTAAAVVERAAALATSADAADLAAAPVTEPSAERSDAAFLETRAMATHEPDAVALGAPALEADAPARAVPTDEQDAAAWAALGFTAPVPASDVAASRPRRRSRRRGWVWAGAAAGAALLVAGHVAAFSLGAAGGATTDRLPQPSPSTTVSEQPSPSETAAPVTVEQASTTTDDPADVPQDSTEGSVPVQPVVAVPVGADTDGVGADRSGNGTNPVDDSSQTPQQPGNGKGIGSDKKAEAGEKGDAGAPADKGSAGGKGAKAGPEKDTAPSP